MLTEQHYTSPFLNQYFPLHMEVVRHKSLFFSSLIQQTSLYSCQQSLSLSLSLLLKRENESRFRKQKAYKLTKYKSPIKKMKMSVDLTNFIRIVKDPLDWPASTTTHI